jgi:hypothetical protein
VSSSTRGGRKTATATVTPTREQVLRAIEARARELDAEEERVVRARHGLPAPATTVLERKAQGEVLDELLLVEMELFRRYRAHLAAAAEPLPSASSPAKDRIVRALRKKR